MEKFIALYLAPVSVLDEWMQTDPETRKSQEETMKADWNAWMDTNAAFVKETYGAGKTKRVTSEGVSEARNDVMMYSIVEAESHDAAAQIYVGHPHLQIPGATIEIMKANSLSGM